MKGRKRIFLIFLIVINPLAIILNTSVFAGINPTFNLTVKNILRHSGPNGQDSIITFELWMQQTNQGQPDVYDFEYCASQFAFRYNKLIHSGGNLVFGIVPEGCELPAILRPPTFQVDSVNGYLRSSGNLPQSLTNYFISGSYPGSKILTFILRTNRKAFNLVPMNLSFKLNPPIGTLVSFFLPYTQDSIQFPGQIAVILTDTVVNHYTVEDSSVTEQVRLISPVYNAVTNRKLINFSWNKHIHASSYRIQISSDIGFSNIILSDTAITDTFRTVGSLSPGSDYFWKVTAKNDSVYFIESYVWTFRLETLQPLLHSPPNNATSVFLPVTFKWSSNQLDFIHEVIPAANSEFRNSVFKEESAPVTEELYDLYSSVFYELEAATDPDLNNIVFIDSMITDTFRTVNSLNLNTEYYWRVTPRNDSLFCTPSPVYKFTTIPFFPLILNSPGNNSTLDKFMVNCSWYRAYDAVSYKLVLSTDTGFTNVVFTDSAITDTFRTINNLLPETRYYWKVSAKRDSEYFAFSAVWSFTTQSILIYPPDGAFNLPTTIDFKWRRVNNALNYILQISASPYFTNFIVNDSTYSDTNKVVSGFDSSRTYFWRVVTIFSDNNVLVSNYRSFAIAGGTPGIIFTISVTLLGSQEVPPNPSPGVGALTGTYNSTTNRISFELVFTNLVGPSIAAHFHGPAGYNENGPVQIGFAGFPLGVTSGSYQNSYILTQEQEIQLLDGLWYVNIHTNDFPGGEIRGQMAEGTLPVELSNFSSRVYRDKITLNWSTSHEINNYGFDIERSNADNNWTKAGYVQGFGNSNEMRNYTFSERLNSGKYKYRLKQIDLNGEINYHEMPDEVMVGVPDKYMLSQNYPNPFNPSTKIDFELPSEGDVNLTVYDISGREVVKLLNEFKTAGYYTVEFNASNFASGIYFYRISAKDFQMTKRMAVVK